MRQHRDPIMPYGDFRGKFIKKIETPYLKSLTEEGGMKTGWLRNVILKELKRRGEHSE